MQEEIADRRAPVIVNYRLNGGYIPLDHWVNTSVGGGRNIGEACHMYDVFRFLSGAPISSIGARAIDPGDKPYLKNDNFVATLGYEDGSVGNLVYTALGPKQGLPKERIEIFCDGECWLVDDFTMLSRTSDNTVLWEGDVEKGHFEELRRLGVCLSGEAEVPIGFSEIVETTAVSLRVEDILNGLEV